MHPDEQDLLAAIENADLKTVTKLATSPHINKQTLTDDLLNPVLCLALKKIDEAKPITIDIADKLITKGYPIDMADDDGNTPLHMAVQTRQIKLMTALIKKGADLHAENENGETPIDVAIEYEVDLVSIYRKHQDNVAKAGKSKENLESPQADNSSVANVSITAEKMISALTATPASVPDPILHPPADVQDEPEAIPSEKSKSQNDSTDKTHLLQGDNSPLEVIQKGKALLDKQQYMEAVYYFKELASAYPKDADILCHYASALYEYAQIMPSNEQKIRLLEASKKYAQDAEAIDELLEESAELLEKIHPQMERLIKQNYGTKKIVLAKLDETDTFLSPSIDESHKKEIMGGFPYVTKGNYKEAVKYLNKFTDLRTDQSDGLYHLGRVFLLWSRQTQSVSNKKKFLEKAFGYMEKSTQQDILHPQSFTILAHIQADIETLDNIAVKTEALSEGQESEFTLVASDKSDLQIVNNALNALKSRKGQYCFYFIAHFSENEIEEERSYNLYYDKAQKVWKVFILHTFENMETIQLTSDLTQDAEVSVFLNEVAKQEQKTKIDCLPKLDMFIKTRCQFKHAIDRPVSMTLRQVALDNQDSCKELKSLIASKTLESLALKDSVVTESAVKELSGVIASDTSLKNFEADCSNLDSDNKQKLLTAFEENRSLETIAIVGTGWTQEELLKVTAIAQRNRENNATGRKALETNDVQEIKKRYSPSELSPKEQPSVNVQADNGETALHWAIRHEDRELTAHLLLADATLTLSNNHHVTPKLQAGQLPIGHEIRKMVEEREAFDQFIGGLKDLYGMTPLKPLKFLIVTLQEEFSLRTEAHQLYYGLQAIKRHLGLAGATVEIFQVPCEKSALSVEEKKLIQTKVSENNVFLVIGTPLLVNNVISGATCVIETLNQIEVQVSKKDAKKSLFSLLWRGEQDTAFPKFPLEEFSKLTRNKQSTQHLPSYANRMTLFDLRDLKNYYRVLVGEDAQEGLLHKVYEPMSGRASPEVAVYSGLYNCFNSNRERLRLNLPALGNLSHQVDIFNQESTVVNEALEKFLSELKALDRLNNQTLQSTDWVAKLGNLVDSYKKRKNRAVGNSGFISYAWESGEDNKKLQDWLKSSLQNHLQKVERDIFLDLSNMSGDMGNAMLNNIKARDFFLIILTEKLKVRACTPVIPGIKPLVSARHASKSHALPTEMKKYLEKRAAAKDFPLKRCLIYYAATSIQATDEQKAMNKWIDTLSSELEKIKIKPCKEPMDDLSFQDQANKSDFYMIVCTPSFKDKVEKPFPPGDTLEAEKKTLSNRLALMLSKDKLMLPLLYDGTKETAIPTFFYDDKNAKRFLALDIAPEPNNLQFEFFNIYKKCKHAELSAEKKASEGKEEPIQSSMLLPILYSGNFSSAVPKYTYDKEGNVVPFDLSKYLIYFFNSEPYARLLTSAFNPQGILPVLLNINANGNLPQDRLYLSLYAGFLQHLRNLGESLKKEKNQSSAMPSYGKGENMSSSLQSSSSAFFKQSKVATPLLTSDLKRMSLNIPGLDYKGNFKPISFYKTLEMLTSVPEKKLKQDMVNRLRHDSDRYKPMLGNVTLENFMERMDKMSDLSDAEVKIAMEVLNKTIVVIEQDGKMRKISDAPKVKGDPIFMVCPTQGYFEPLYLTGKAHPSQIIRALEKENKMSTQQATSSGIKP